MASPDTPRRHRLARAVQQLLGVSFSRAKREVETGHVLVDGLVVIDPGAWVAVGATIRHDPARPRRTRGPRLPALPILHLDADVIVINKETVPDARKAAAPPPSSTVPVAPQQVAPTPRQAAAEPSGRAGEPEPRHARQ